MSDTRRHTFSEGVRFNIPRGILRDNSQKPKELETTNTTSIVQDINVTEVNISHENSDKLETIEECNSEKTESTSTVTIEEPIKISDSNNNMEEFRRGSNINTTLGNLFKSTDYSHRARAASVSSII